MFPSGARTLRTPEGHLGRLGGRGRLAQLRQQPRARGRYQLRSPSSFIETGSRIARTIVASIRTGSPTPARARMALGLMAEGRSDAAIAAELVVSERAVEKHVTGIFSKLDLPASGDGHRRVLAVLRFLEDPA